MFWGAFGVLVYIYAAYPALMRCLARLFPHRSTVLPGTVLPSVTVVLCAHNEARRIARRLQNLLASDYPKDKIEIVVVSDGSTDTTAEQVRALNEPRIRLLSQARRAGKSHCLNLALADARGQVVVFCDTRQRFAPQTVAKLVRHFSDPQIGAVSGSLEIDPATSNIGSGIDVYWRIEKFLRFAESRFDSCIGCTGAVYAIRRKIFQPLPPETLLDDVVIPMQIAMQDFRVAFEPEAVAFDPQTLEPEHEKIRKRRTLAGNYQMLFRNWRWLLPWRNRLWWMLISHKYLRLAAPLFLLIMFAANFFLVEQPVYRALFVGQSIFYLMAIYGLIFSAKRGRLFSIPAGFVFLNWMALSGLWHYIRQPSKNAWGKASNV